MMIANVSITASTVVGRNLGNTMLRLPAGHVTTRKRNPRTERARDEARESGKAVFVLGTRTLLCVVAFAGGAGRRVDRRIIMSTKKASKRPPPAKRRAQAQEGAAAEDAAHESTAPLKKKGSGGRQRTLVEWVATHATAEDDTQFYQLIAEVQSN